MSENNNISIGQLAEQLNNKVDVDLKNINPDVENQKKKTIEEETQNKLLIDYTSAIILNAGGTYTMENNGLISVLFGGKRNNTITINGIRFSEDWNADYGSPDYLTLPVAKGDIITTTCNLVFFRNKG